MSKRTDKIAQTRRANTLKRAQHVQKRFNELYEVKRKRVDDCIKIIADELFLSESTVEADLKRET